MARYDDLDDYPDFDDHAFAFEPVEERSALAPEAERAPLGPVPLSSRALVEGETGVGFDALVLFAEPLFGLYGLDLAEAFALKADPAAAEPEVLAVLETARVLWAFFSLPQAERAHRRDALAAHLVGPEPTDDDWVDVEGLLDTVEPYWRAMLPEERALAEQGPRPPLGFDALLAHPAFAIGPRHDAQTYGHDDLSEIEARALFAQPLLDDPEALASPDAFEWALSRASAYWTLALKAPPERETALGEVVTGLLNGRGDRAFVEAEARRMVARFEALFPEHSRVA